jgi:hypothetical protein
MLTVMGVSDVAGARRWNFRDEGGPNAGSKGTVSLRQSGRVYRTTLW